MFPFFLAALASLVAAPAAQPQSGIIGTWMNPKGTIAVRTERCRSGICGKVVWASRAAEEEARSAGAGKLVGTELLHGFRQTGPGRWQGQAFVPDIGGTFESEIVQLGANQLQIEGCRFGRLLCKRQLWQRTRLPARRR